MFFNIQDIQKHPEGIAFSQVLQLKEELSNRNQEILDISPIQVEGKIRFEANVYFLEYQMSYDLTLASSRSMKPVLLAESQSVLELFVEEKELALVTDLIEEEMVLVLEQEIINLAESVADNILLNIPSKVLTPAEEKGEGFLEGKDWVVLTEEDYQQTVQESKKEQNPFAKLQGLFDEE